MGSDGGLSAEDIVAAMTEGMFSDASGLSVEEANDILDELILCYEPLFPSPPASKTFQECYNLDTITPTEEYTSV